MNREHVKINWRFDRRAARRKFGYGEVGLESAAK